LSKIISFWVIRFHQITPSLVLCFFDILFPIVVSVLFLATCQWLIILLSFSNPHPTSFHSQRPVQAQKANGYNAACAHEMIGVDGTAIKQ
jgi:hypothetical protein